MPTQPLRAHRSGFLRAEPSSFLGRASELDRVHAPTRKSRLVTIVGPGGIGKTRLALRYGTMRRDDYRSVWFCDVSEAQDVEQMTSIVLRMVGVTDRNATAFERALSARPGALIILDNLEHLLPEAAATIREWVNRVPEVRFIVTSRLPLGIAEEELLELGALALPPPGTSSGDAVALFVDRVRSHHGTYSPREDELPIIAEIVRHLHGVPLAIELAAARVGVEHPRDLLTRVAARSTPPPAGGASAASTRRVIDRAFALLAPAERATLCQCSVFRGSFTMPAAQQVVRLDGGEDVSEILVALARKSLLQVERFDPLRMAMCEGIKAHAAEILAASPDASDVEWRHAWYFFERARDIARLGTNPAPPDAFDDREDLQAAMALGATASHPQIVLRAALALDAISNGAGLGSLELGYLDEALRDGAAHDLALLGRALGVRASSLYALGRLTEARRDAEMALRLGTELGDQRQMGAMHLSAGESCFQLGDFAAAREHLQRALQIELERGEQSAIAAVHYHMGSLLQSVGEASAAREEFESSLAIALATGDAAREARAVMGLAWDRFEGGDHEAALVHYEHALRILRRLKLLRSERIVVGYMGLLHFDLGMLDVARDHLERAVLAARQAGDFRIEGIFEGIRGGVLAAQDRIEEARAAFELTDHLLEGNAFFAASIAIHRGHLDLALARAALARGDSGGALVHQLHAQRFISTARADLVRRSDDARMAVRILERALASVGE